MTANGFLRGLGMAPGANLIEQLYSPTFTQAGGMLTLMTESYRNHAIVSGNSWGPAATPQGYQAFIRASRGEFTCVKPAYVRLATAWISDRTLCYLATGRPAVVQDTGPSRILPAAEGLLRFADVDSAARYLREADERHDRHARAARDLAEEHFDARKVTRALLERGL